jgi:hypothetical protein
LLALMDDGFGECVKKIDNGKVEHVQSLSLIDGVNKGSIIASMFGSRTSVHVEDAFLGTYNLLLIGAPKAWYMIPKKCSCAFRYFLSKMGLLHTILTKV